jgi:hypothetical protein
MKQAGIKLTVIWEEVSTPDAQQRLAAAFAMLLGPQPTPDPPEQGIDIKN